MPKFLIFILFFSLFLFGEEAIESIRPVLDLYDRPITVLSVGENEMIHQIASEYGATCIVAEGKKITRLGTDQVIHLKKTFSLLDLKDLNKADHFDIVLVTESLKRFKNWKETLHELFKLGDQLIIEMPLLSESSNPSEKGIAYYLTNLGLTVHLKDSSHAPLLWYCFKPKSVQPELYRDHNPRGSKAWAYQEKKKLPFLKRFLKNFI